MSNKPDTTTMRPEKQGEVTPKLRFPEFRDAGMWEVRQLEFVCDMKAGQFVAASDIFEQYEEGLYPCYGGNGLRGYTRTHTHSGTYSLIGRQGALCGNVNLTIGQFHATEHAVVTTPKDDIEVQWLFYNLVNLNLNQYATGQAQPGLSVAVLEKVSTAVPSNIKEQQKIADCLTSLDDLIAAHNQKLDALRAYKKGLLQQLFPAEGETVPKLRFPEFRDAGTWEVKKLRDIATIKAGATPSRSNPQYYDGGNIPWVKTTDLNNSFIYVTEECITPYAKSRINPKDTVLVAMYGGFNQIGRTGYLKVPAATNQAISVLNTNKKILLPLYLLIWLNAKVDNWKKYASSSRKDPNITGSDVANFPIIFPSIVEQQKIANFISSFDEQITAQNEKIDALKEHKKGLLQQLFPSPEVAR